MGKKHHMTKSEWFAYKRAWAWWPGYMLNIVRSSRAVDEMMDRRD